MDFVGDVVDGLFGGTATDAADVESAGYDRAAELYQQGVQEAKDEIFPAFEQASIDRLNRYNQIQQLLGGSFGPQLDVYNQGNMNAQQTIAGAAPQMANAILGGQVDYSGLQPQGINFNPADYLAGMGDLFAPPPAPTTTPTTPPVVTPPLGGGGGPPTGGGGGGPSTGGGFGSGLGGYGYGGNGVGYGTFLGDLLGGNTPSIPQQPFINFTAR